MLSISVKIYDKPKYDKESNEIAEMPYNITGYEVICGGTAADKIESETDSNSVDDNHEYLILHLENGETATFRNTYVDMFAWRDNGAQEGGE